MFDSVGRDTDEEALKRSAQSAGLLTLLVGMGAGVFFLAGLYVVQETELIPVLEDMVMAELVEEADFEAPPPPPPPPPPPAAADASDEEEEPEETPTPDEMVEKVEELKQEVKEEMKSDAKPAGVVGGQEGGVVGGVVGGVQGGVVGGVIGGQLGSTGGAPKYRTVRQSEIEWKTQPMPSYPDAARGLGFGDTGCKATLSLNAEGLVEDVKVNPDCPKVFQSPLRESLMKWKAYPYRVDGQKVAVQFTGLFTFKER